MRLSIQVVPFLFLVFLLLTGCDSSWEGRLTNTAFPYGNERTAGSGYEYVLAKLAPPKSLKLTPVKRLRRVVVLPEPARDMDHLLRNKMVK